MAKSPKSRKTRAKAWEPSPLDAMNLASLHYFAMLIEQTSISIYASDNKKRTKFNAMRKDLAAFIATLRSEYGENEGQSGKGHAFTDCYDSWVLCSGMCVDPELCP